MTSTDQFGNGNAQRYEAMGRTAAGAATSNRLEADHTDKLIDAIAHNNHQPHLELDNVQSSSNNHPLIPPSQVTVSIEQTADAAATATAATTKTAPTLNNHVVDMIGDQVAPKDRFQLNGHPTAIANDRIV